MPFFCYSLASLPRPVASAMDVRRPCKAWVPPATHGQAGEFAWLKQPHTKIIHGEGCLFRSISKQPFISPTAKVVVHSVKQHFMHPALLGYGFHRLFAAGWRFVAATNPIADLTYSYTRSVGADDGTMVALSRGAVTQLGRMGGQAIASHSLANHSW
jgi:hypothetical protein